MRVSVPGASREDIDVRERRCAHRILMFPIFHVLLFLKGSGLMLAGQIIRFGCVGRRHRPCISGWSPLLFRSDYRRWLPILLLFP